MGSANVLLDAVGDAFVSYAADLCFNCVPVSNCHSMSTMLPSCRERWADGVLGKAAAVLRTDEENAGGLLVSSPRLCRAA